MAPPTRERSYDTSPPRPAPRKISVASLSPSSPDNGRLCRTWSYLCSYFRTWDPGFTEWRRRRESNPRMEVLQTSALPLGYSADCEARRLGPGAGLSTGQEAGIDAPVRRRSRAPATRHSYQGTAPARGLSPCRSRSIRCRAAARCKSPRTSSNSRRVPSGCA